MEHFKYFPKVTGKTKLKLKKKKKIIKLKITTKRYNLVLVQVEFIFIGCRYSKNTPSTYKNVIKQIQVKYLAEL